MASWTEKCVSQLKLLHEEGFSATVIAKKLGPDFTKGMVLGKLSRLALAEAPKPQETRKASVQRVIPPKEVPARRLTPHHRRGSCSRMRVARTRRRRRAKASGYTICI